MIEERFMQTIPADFFEFAFIQIQIEISIRPFGQRLPVPVIFIFFRQILIDLFSNDIIRLQAGFIFQIADQLLVIHITNIRGIHFDVGFLTTPGGHCIPAVIFIEQTLCFFIDLAFDHFQDQIAAVAAIQNPLTVAIDGFSLFVHDFIIFQQMLTLLEMGFFPFLLCPFDTFGNHSTLDGLPLFHAQTRQDVFYPFAGKHPHQFVFE